MAENTTTESYSVKSSTKPELILSAMADFDVATPGFGGSPSNVILAPHPNEFQPMKYPVISESAQMYGGIGLTAGNKPTYG